MNILILAADGDWSGAGYALKDAIERHTPHRARAISYRRTSMQYPYDVLNPSPAQVLEWIHWCDVLNLHDDGARRIPSNAPYRPVVATYHGSWYRRGHKKINHRARLPMQAGQPNVVQTCLTIDLALYGPKWIGRAIPDLSHLRHPDPTTFRIAHAPSQPRRKGTDIVRVSLAGLPGVHLDVIHDISNEKCLQRKAKAHVLVDQIGPKGFGYGTNALEAWALGIPVISSAPSHIVDAITKHVGHLPFLPVTGAQDLRQAVERLRDSPALYARWCDIGIRYVRTYHDPATIAQWFTDLCLNLTPVSAPACADRCAGRGASRNGKKNGKSRRTIRRRGRKNA